MKLLTIGIPVFNRFELLKATLTLNIEALIPFADSVELLISDNGSEQNVREHLKMLAEEYPNLITIVGFDQNQGYSNNYFNILKNSHTEYLWIIGSDDYLIRNGIEFLLNQIKTTKYHFYYTVHQNLNLRTQVPRKIEIPLENYTAKAYSKLADLIDSTLNDTLLGSLTTGLFKIHGMVGVEDIEQNLRAAGRDSMLKYFPQSMLFAKLYMDTSAAIIEVPTVVVCDGAREWSSGDTQIRYWDSSLPYVHFLASKEMVAFLKANDVNVKNLTNLKKMNKHDLGRHFWKLFSLQQSAIQFKQENKLGVSQVLSENIFDFDFITGAIMELLRIPVRPIKKMILNLFQRKSRLLSNKNKHEDIFM